MTRLRFASDRRSFTAALVLSALLAAPAFAQAPLDLKIVAPAGPGGGWDTASGEVAPGGYLLRVGGAEPMELLCECVVNSAGFNAQAVSRSIAGIPGSSVPATHYAIGHYYTLAAKSPFNRLIYPVARQDWLGVHVTIAEPGGMRAETSTPQV